MADLESLGFDRNRKVSSQPLVKSGPNRGRRHPERGGTWQYMSGYTSHAPHGERSAHHEWAKHLLALGFRVGSNYYEGVTSLYLFQPTTTG